MNDIPACADYASMFVRRGSRSHLYQNGEWMTLRDGTWTPGYDPDPDYKEPEPLYKRVLFEFKVMWSGWECDDDAKVVELADGTIALAMTDHCREYIAEPSRLEEKLAEYEEVIADTRKALDMLRVSDAHP